MTIHDTLEGIAERLVNQDDEPMDWTAYAARMNYWRDKAIYGSREIRALLRRVPVAQPRGVSGASE